jgi:hypothetical protein
MAIDYTIFAGEPYDPCAALAVLRPVYMQMRVEGTVKRIKFRDRDTEFAPADLSSLAELIAQLESDCSTASGASKRRFAITAGARIHNCCIGGWWRR